MASRILDMGDVLTLIEQASAPSITDQAQRMAKARSPAVIRSPSRFLEQMRKPSRRWGRWASCSGDAPGMAEARKQLEQIDDRELDGWPRSSAPLTPQNDGRHEVLNGSQQARIAKAPACRCRTSQQPRRPHRGAQKMMKRMRSGGEGVPGLPGIPHARRNRRRPKGNKPPKIKKSRNSPANAPRRTRVTEQQPDARCPDQFTDSSKAASAGQLTHPA